MKCLDDYHTYELETFMKPTIEDLEKILDGPPLKTELLPDGSISAGKVILKFYEMCEDGTKIDGVTNEEVIEVLIHRLGKLNEKLPCRENSIVITKLEECRFWLNQRTKNRIDRKVEGTHAP